MTKQAMKPVDALAIVYEDGRIYIDSTITSERDLAGAIAQNEKASIKKVRVTEWRKRSLSASALFHVWCQQISDETGDDIITTKQTMKINFGYPILKANPEMWPRMSMLFRGCNWWLLSWEGKLKMAEIIPCTSLMTTPELRQMMENIKQWAMSELNMTLHNGNE